MGSPASIRRRPIHAMLIVGHRTSKCSPQFCRQWRLQLMSLSAWLGGSLIYSHGVAAEPTEEEQHRRAA
jgi:hypothetical protein